MEDYDNPSLVELVRAKLWREARARVELFPSSVYRTNNPNRSLAIHELCNQVRFIDHHEEEEFSDEEDDVIHTVEDRLDNREIYALAELMIAISLIEEPRLLPLSEDDDGRVRFGVCQSVLEARDSNGNTPLHILCSKSADTTMMHLMLSMTADSAHRLISAQNDHGCTPVHFLAESTDCPYSALKLILSWFPPGYGVQWLRDDDADTPLHWALALGISPRRIQLLLRGDEAFGSLMAWNSAKRLPMNDFVDCQCEGWERLHGLELRQLWTRVEALLKVVCVVYGGEERWSPLHAIAASLAYLPNDIVSMALKFCQDDLGALNSVGKTPLHTALSMPPPRYDVLDTLSFFLEDERVNYDIRTSAGQLPIHLAIDTGMGTSIIEKILKRAPLSLTTADPMTQLPPAVQAAVDDHQKLDVIYVLLRSDPSILLNR